MVFSGISRGRPTYTSNHLGDVFVVQELNRVAPGKGSIKGISPAKMGVEASKNRDEGRATLEIYMYNEKMVTRSISRYPIFLFNHIWDE